MLGLVEKFTTFRLALGKAGDLEVLHLPAHFEALEYVASWCEVELLLFRLDVFVFCLGLRGCDAGVAFESFSESN